MTWSIIKKQVQCSEQRVFWQIRSISFQRETSKSQSCLTLNWKPDKLHSAYKVYTLQFRPKNHEEQKMSLAVTFLSQEKAFSKKLKGRFSL